MPQWRNVVEDPNTATVSSSHQVSVTWVDEHVTYCDVWHTRRELEPVGASIDRRKRTILSPNKQKIGVYWVFQYNVRADTGGQVGCNIGKASPKVGSLVDMRVHVVETVIVQHNVSCARRMM